MISVTRQYELLSPNEYVPLGVFVLTGDNKRVEFRVSAKALDVLREGRATPPVIAVLNRVDALVSEFKKLVLSEEGVPGHSGDTISQLEQLVDSALIAQPSRSSLSRKEI
jgi:hypothetical protein